MRKFKIFADGGCQNNGNQNAKAYGSFAKCSESGRTEIVRLKFDIAKTNNQAEYVSLLSAIHALSSLVSQDIKAQIDVFMDSALVINQVTGAWNTKKPELRVLRDASVEGLNYLQQNGVSVSLIHVPREEIVKVLGH